MNPTQDMARFLSPVLFLVIGVGLSTGMHLLFPTVGTPGASTVVVGALLASTALIATGIWRDNWQSWIIVGLLWGSVQASTTLLNQPWFDAVRICSSLMLLAGLAMAAYGKDLSRGVIPVRHPHEAMLAATAPLAFITVTTSRFF
ncbi:MAG: hypothetical protein R2849_21460 [Thermomicrobiales bacterium]